MAQNTYTVNGGLPLQIDNGYADINMSTEAGVKVGCRQYPIPLLNKITVTSTDGGLYSAKAIYAGYKVVNQLLGEIVPTGSHYNTTNPLLSTIISNARFGMFEPAHYNGNTSWNTHYMMSDEINSLINVGTGVKICVKIEYTKNNGSPAVEYVPIDGASNRFDRYDNKQVPRYSDIGGSILTDAETVQSSYIDSPANRPWFESVLNTNILNVGLDYYITDPKTSENMTVTLMAYIGNMPTANNTFRILPISAISTTSITCQFETYEPTIDINNKDYINNPDNYADRYGSVAEYDTGTPDDTTISIIIVAP